MIKERIIELIEFKGLPKEKFYSDIGMTSANFRGTAKERPLNSNTIENIISVIPDVNIDWLLTGKEPMLKEDIPKALPALNPNEGIPLIPLDAMAGVGRGEISVMELDCERYVVPVFKGADYLVPIKGSSMYPKYSSGDIVACKKLPLKDIFFQWNKVYVLDTIQGPIIKRIKKGSVPERILLVSENENYDPFEIPITQINSLAIVMGVIRLE